MLDVLDIKTTISNCYNFNQHLNSKDFYVQLLGL